MIKVQMINPQSAYWNQCGFVSEQDWAGDSFWVAVSIKGTEMLMARRNLREV